MKNLRLPSRNSAASEITGVVRRWPGKKIVERFWV